MVCRSSGRGHCTGMPGQRAANYNRRATRYCSAIALLAHGPRALGVLCKGPHGKRTNRRPNRFFAAARIKPKKIQEENRTCACTVLRLRNRRGTQHGRYFMPGIRSWKQHCRRRDAGPALRLDNRSTEAKDGCISQRLCGANFSSTGLDGMAKQITLNSQNRFPCPPGDGRERWRSRRSRLSGVRFFERA